jgi:hypothetical protein
MDQARRHYADLLLKDMQPLRDAAMAAAHALADQTAERAIAQQRQDLLQDLTRHIDAWPARLAASLQDRLTPTGAPSTASGTLLTTPADQTLRLLDDETVQRNILISRLTLAILDRTTWEFADLRARLSQLSDQIDLDEDDLFRPQTVARSMLKSWMEADLALQSWRALEAPLQKACCDHVERAFVASNAWLVQRGVLPQVDLKPFIRRASGQKSSSLTPSAAAPKSLPTRPSARSALEGEVSDGAGSGPSAWPATPLGANITRQMPLSISGEAEGGLGTEKTNPGLALRPQGGWRTDASHAPYGMVAGGDMASASQGAGGPSGAQPYTDEETRMMTHHAGVAGLARAEAVLQRFSDIVEQHLPGFTNAAGRGQPSMQLGKVMAQVQERVASRVEASGEVGAVEPSPAQLVAELRERQQTLKDAASTPEERATVELVALLFQSILTDDRVPAVLRIWFARLQMPVLRVALAEPDFFSGADHPTRRLIDRIGGCVMGFEGDAEVIGTPLEAEIRRIVQVIEAFPDTGRRVFQAVLTEFERFLERYLRESTDAARAGVSLAQQIEQRETLAIQYTIELRKMVNDLPVQEGVRDFLFHIWADVLATAAVRHGPKSEEINAVRGAAAELLWAASAKTTREERAEVIHRVPPLISALRQGMGAAGLAARKQEEAMKALNLALTAAFSARAISISPEQMNHLKQSLEALEEMLPEGDLDLDDSWVLDEAHHQHEGLEVVTEGGSMPQPEMLASAAALQLGSAFKLEYRGRRDTVRLSWQGMHKQLALFVSAKGKCILFQKMRLAAFLQAGLLVPLEDESLTQTATRAALRKIGADPARLTH